MIRNSKMKEIDSHYFHSIGKYVNDVVYNNRECNKTNAIHLDDNIAESDHDKVKVMIKSDGFCVVQIKMDDKICRSNIGRLLENMVGPLYYGSGSIKMPFEKIQSKNHATFYINSSLTQPMHTDEGYTNTFPRYVGLYCEKPAESGGENIVVNGASLYSECLNQYGEKINLLFEKDALTVEHAFGIDQKPLFLLLNNQEIGISYSPILKKMWCSEDVFDMFDYITHYVHHPDNQFRFKLESGQILLFDNAMVCHGRTAFPKNDKRLMYRYWFEMTMI